MKPAKAVRSFLTLWFMYSSVFGHSWHQARAVRFSGFSDYTKYHSRRGDAKRRRNVCEIPRSRKEKAAPPTEADDTACFAIFQPPFWYSKLAYRLKRPAPTVVAVVATIATEAPEAFVVTAQEAAPVRLTVAAAVSVVAVVTMAVPVEVRPLRIVILSALRIIRTGVETVLIPLVHRNLVVVAIATV